MNEYEHDVVLDLEISQMQVGGRSYIDGVLDHQVWQGYNQLLVDYMPSHISAKIHIKSAHCLWTPFQLRGIKVYVAVHLHRTTSLAMQLES